MGQDSNAVKIRNLQIAISAIDAQIRQIHASANEQITRLDADRHAYERELNLLLCRLNPELIELAKKVLYVEGPVNTDTRRLLVIEAIQDISQNTQLLKSRWIGVYCDSDGYEAKVLGDYTAIWKSPQYEGMLLIGLNEEIREHCQHLSESEIEACLYYLYKIEEIQRAERK